MDFSSEYHQPVLLEQVINNLLGSKGQIAGWYLDGTLGDGGYSVDILRQGGRVVGIDVDPEALDRAESRFKRLGITKDCYTLIQGNFRELENLILQTETKQIKFNGLILDLGVSSLQLADPGRGFSFIKDGPLDMRMDPTLQVTAADLVNALNRKELYELFNKLGEERYSRDVADTIISTRGVTKFETTKQLADLVAEVYKKKGVYTSKINPATKIFQALRIAVNDELGVLKDVLTQIPGLMQIYGRVEIITFHSLEDRIVKHTFREWERKGLGKIITKKPIVAENSEIQSNPKARSAKLRVFEIEKL